MSYMIVARLLMAFIITIIAQKASANGSDDSIALRSYLAKYDLLKFEHLYIVTVNPSLCAKCRIGMTKLNDRVKNGEKRNNVIYLLCGMREGELDYYIRNELSFLSPTENRFILDDSFYNLVDPDHLSSLVHIYKNRIKESMYINEGDRMTILANKKVTVIDSVKVDEAAAPISRGAKLHIIDEDNFLLVDNRYNKASFYEKGKLKRSLKLDYDYSGLYKKYISVDTSRISFAARRREGLKQMGLKEIELGSLCVNGSNVYITCNMLFSNRKQSSADTIINNYPFLIITDTAFSKQEYVMISPTQLYFPMFQNNFFTRNDTHFVFTFMYDGNVPGKQYLTEYRYDRSIGTLSFIKPLKVELPAFFTEKHIEIFGPNNVAMVDDQPVFYFNWAVPFLFNKDSLIYAYPDTSYKSFTAKMWKSAPLKFEMMKFAEWDKNTLILFTSEEKKYYVSLVDKASQKIIMKEELPSQVTPFPNIHILDKEIYALVPRAKAFYMYRLSLEHL